MIDNLYPSVLERTFVRIIHLCLNAYQGPQESFEQYQMVNPLQAPAELELILPPNESSVWYFPTCRRSHHMRQL